ncbi:DUF6282 family protein [Brevibacillus marinus]|uniref:DUF6282 family protein n=1 Tax=Brevibacillus marinus TaxID=2496837 RepID=UPI000F837D27|nr:DUF6282 family protein [Brevibacillus marinus]
MEINELFQGAYDLHVHTGPDVLPRKLDDLEMTERIRRLGMKGYGIKSHYFVTSARAKLLNQAYPGMNVIGAICLNNSVGGLNPIAVEMAALDGAKIVWMPTFDAENEQRHFRTSKPEKLPHWAKLRQEFAQQGNPLPTISLLEGTELKPEVHEILRIISKYDLVLATGHVGKDEIFALVEAAGKSGVQKIVVTHPSFPSIRLSIAEQKELAQRGAYMEHCFTTPHSHKDTWESIYEQIRAVGPQHCILSSDLGQPTGLYPDEGMQLFVRNLLDNGFRREEIRTMIADNPRRLVEKEG